MASTKITEVKMKWNEMSEQLIFTAASEAADGFMLSYKEQDAKLAVLVKNEHASEVKTITIKKGNGIQGVADSEAFSIPSGGVCCIRLESGRFKHVSGEHKGNVVMIPESTDIQVAVIALP